MKAPGFWYPPEGAGLPLAARLLAPVSALWSFAGRLRFRGAPGYEGRAPLVCVGNAVAGGAGKTPTAIAIGRRLMERGHAVHFLSRGHGGTEEGPLQVDPGSHTAAEVGDEPLLLAAYAPAWIAKDRVAGATAADAAGADVIVMDDGLQNHPSLRRDLAILVVDAAQ
ncbi:MAG: tetraacyldisaccharide 4'-kinase, partial [Alphaproteobacteria bacterium]|nr:tetraacyldisaccharide 4'-kinase [Alphaproteobacteria bacterium]